MSEAPGQPLGEKSGQLHHLEFYVEDLAATTVFWGWFLPRLGYEAFQNWPAGRSWRHASGTYLVFVQLSPDRKGESYDRHGRGLNHLAFTGPEAGNLAEFRDEVRARGGRILEDSHTVFCFAEGNDFAVEVYAGAP